MLSKTQGFLLDILADFANGRKTDRIPDDIDWQQLADISKNQEVGAIVYYQIGEMLKADLKLQNVYKYFEKAYAVVFLFYQNRIHILGEVNKEFAHDKIPYYVFKGTEIASYYPVPELRSMGDSDICVKKGDRKRADAALTRLGFDCTLRCENEWVYNYNGMEFELHERMMNDSDVGNLKSHKEFMARHWEYAVDTGDGTHYKLDDSYHFVFIILHLRKHLINYGAGFRQFLDLAVMNNECNLDWDYINKELKNLGIFDFAQKCFAFCRKWFDVRINGTDEEIDPEFYTPATESIFTGGVFGFSDSENSNNYAVLQFNAEENKRFFAIKKFFRAVFPSYDTLIQNVNYEFLKGRKYLLPFAWVYRCVKSLLTGKSKKSLTIATGGFKIEKEQIEKRNEYLENWCLK